MYLALRASVFRVLDKAEAAAAEVPRRTRRGALHRVQWVRFGQPGQRRVPAVGDESLENNTCSDAKKSHDIHASF